MSHGGRPPAGPSGRDAAAYRFIEGYVRRKLYAPSIREVAAAAGFSTPSGAYRCLGRLEAAGLIRLDGGPRRITLTGYRLERLGAAQQEPGGAE